MIFNKANNRKYERFKPLRDTIGNPLTLFCDRYNTWVKFCKMETCDCRNKRELKKNNPI